jgi:hypothetical protein
MDTKRFLAGAAAAACALVLSACGGGGSPAAMPSPQAAVLASSACDTQALASGEAQLVGSDCVRSSTVVTPQRAALQPLAAASITANQLMDWAEAQYPTLFPTQDRVSGVLTPYTYRYYPSKGNYLGVTASDATPSVYLYGNIAGWQITRVGAVADFACSVSPSSCTGTTTTTTGTTTTGSSSSSSTAGVQCSYSYNAFNSSASVKMNSTASWSCSSTQRSLTGNGVPDHDVGTFPSANNPSSIKSLTVNAAMPLTPALASSTTTNVHVIGYAFNSVKMDPATAATCAVSGSTVTCTADGNTGTWNIEAMGQTYMNLGLDSSNAHVQPDGSYHYHGMPEGYLTKLGKGATMTLVGFALDGFPIYARYGYSTATSASSAIKVVTSSYKLKTTPSSGRPSTSTYPMGLFTQDYEYSAGSGDLDECNGRFGVTPEFPNGIYHYVITDTWPYMGRCLKGTPTTGAPR